MTNTSADRDLVSSTAPPGTGGSSFRRSTTTEQPPASHVSQTSRAAFGIRRKDLAGLATQGRTNPLLKTPEELALMAEAGTLLASVFAHLDRLPLRGMSTLAINDLVEKFIVEILRARPSSKGQYDFGFVLNSSINNVVCHGVPCGHTHLKDGDIVNLDITLEKNGFLADSSKTYLIGDVGEEARRLVQVTYEALWKGIRAVYPGAHLGDIGYAIQRHATKHGYSVVRDFCGHGIGREMHEEPKILHTGRLGTGLRIEEGMVFTIEPLLNLGRPEVRRLADGWTIETLDGKLSAQFEHTIAVTAEGYKVLTLRPDEIPPTEG